MEFEGQPTEEPPADTRQDVNQILQAVVPAPSVLSPIPEESDSMGTTMPEVAESGPGYGFVSLKANHAVSRLTGMSDHA